MAARTPLECPNERCPLLLENLLEEFKKHVDKKFKCLEDKIKDLDIPEGDLTELKGDVENFKKLITPQEEIQQTEGQ